MRLESTLLATALASKGFNKAYKKSIEQRLNRKEKTIGFGHWWPDEINEHQCKDRMYHFNKNQNYFRPSLTETNDGLSGTVKLEDYSNDMSCHVVVEAAAECRAIQINLVSLAFEHWQYCGFDQMRFQWENENGETLHSYENCGCFGDGCQTFLMAGTGNRPFSTSAQPFSYPWSPLNHQNNPKVQNLTINQNKFKIMISTDEYLGGGGFEVAWSCLNNEEQETTMKPDPMDGSEWTSTAWVTTTAYAPDSGTAPNTMKPVTHEPIDTTTYTSHFEWSTAWFPQSTTAEPTTTTTTVENCQNHHTTHEQFQTQMIARIEEVVARVWRSYSKVQPPGALWIPVPQAPKNAQKTRLFTRWLTNVFNQSHDHILNDRKCFSSHFPADHPGTLSKSILGQDCKLGFDWSLLSICEKLGDYFDWLYANCNVPPPAAASRKQRLTHRCDRMATIVAKIKTHNDELWGDGGWWPGI